MPLPPWAVSLPGACLSVLGTPVAQPRPRISTRGGFPRAYYPKGSGIKAWMDTMGEIFTEEAPPLLRGPLSVEITFWLKRPKSHLKRSGDLGSKATWLPVGKPDLDNLVKAVLDAGNDRLWVDDAQVCHLDVTKLWAISEYDDLEPGIEITVHPLGAGDMEPVAG